MGEFEGEIYGNAFLRFAFERLGAFYREQRPDGRPETVPVRQKPDGHRQQSKGVSSPSR